LSKSILGIAREYTTPIENKIAKLAIKLNGAEKRENKKQNKNQQKERRRKPRNFNALRFTRRQKTGAIMSPHSNRERTSKMECKFSCFEGQHNNKKTKKKKKRKRKKRNSQPK
jgi:hypothetical protein